MLAVPREQVVTCLLQLVSGVEGAFKSWLGRQSEGEVSTCNHNVSWYSMHVCTVSGWGVGVGVYVEGEGRGGGVCLCIKLLVSMWRIKNLINMSVIKAEYLSSGVIGGFLW